MSENKKSLDYYLGLKYPVQTIQNEDGSWFAKIPNLPGCMTEADSLEEVYKMIEEAKQGWIKVRYKKGLNIPSPETEKKYSGKILARMPKELHSFISKQAEEQGVSLNQWINYLVATNASYYEKNKTLNDVLREMERYVEHMTVSLIRLWRDSFLVGREVSTKPMIKHKSKLVLNQLESEEEGPLAA